MSERLQGLGVSSGIADGRVVLLPTMSLPVVPVPVPPERVEEEIRRFEGAVEQATRELGELRERTREMLGESYAGILDAQLLIVVDASLVSGIVQRIRMGRVSASWALKEIIGEFAQRFEAIDDPYLRERVGDLEDVHLRLQRLLRGEVNPKDAVTGDEPRIVVAHSLGPSDAVLLARQNIAGFATDVGGKTSHTAILAQALSVPAVVGLHDISERVRSGDDVILDGDTGLVVLQPEEDDRHEARRRQKDLADREDTLADTRDLPVVTRDGVEVRVQANIEFPQEVAKAVHYGARGIGLYRSEFLFLSRSPEFPSEDEHYRTYLEMAEAMAPHQVTVRTLDLGGEKYYHEMLDRRESNPVLGLRAVRFCLKRPDIFRPQLRGLLRAGAQADLRIMIPLVSNVEEIRDVRRLLSQEAEDLKAHGIPCRADLPVGIMIEVPAAAIAADLLASESDFFAIGTNDLIQYSLAVDRGNESVVYLYQPLHPAVLRMLKFVVESADRAGIPVSLCGEIAADASMSGLLLGMGIRELSVQPRAVGPVIRAVRELVAAEETEVMERALAQPTADDVARVLRERRPSHRVGRAEGD